MAKKKAVAKKPAKLLKAAKTGKADKVTKTAAKAKPAKGLARKAPKATKALRGKGFHHVNPTRRLDVPKSAGSGDALKMIREVDKRVQQYERDILKARKAIEKISQVIQKPALAPSGKPERGPRRFRSGVVKIRDLQREMTDSSTQMRIAAARRQELLWVKMLVTGEMPGGASPAAVVEPVPAPEPPPDTAS